VIVVILNIGDANKTLLVKTAALWDPDPASRSLAIVRTSGAAGAPGSTRLTPDTGLPQKQGLSGDYPVTLPGQSLTTVVIN